MASVTAERVSYIRQLVVSSGDNESFSVNFQSDINDVTGVRVSWANITNSLPTIVSGYNDSFIARIGIVDSTIVIPEGNYTTADLAVELEVQLQVVDGSYTVTVSEVGRLIVSRVGAFVLNFDDAKVACVMGFPAESVFVAGTTVTAPMPANVAPWLAAAITCNEVDRHTSEMGIDPLGFTESYLVTMPIDFPFLVTVRQEPRSLFFNRLDSRSHFRRIDFQLRHFYCDGAALPLGTFAIAPWSMELDIARDRS